MNIKGLFFCLSLSNLLGGWEPYGISRNTNYAVGKKQKEISKEKDLETFHKGSIFKIQFEGEWDLKK